MESIVTWFTSTLGAHISREAMVFIISLFPILELRGGLIAAVLLKVPMWRAIFLCVAGNILPIPFILLLIRKILNWMKKFKIFRKLVTRIEERAMKKKDGIQKAEFWGLTAFVGIPLPGTGAWTGALIAALLNIDFKKAIKAELLGICIATVIMALISYGLIGHIVH